MRHLSRMESEVIGDRVLNAYYKLPTVNKDQLWRIEPEVLIQEVLNLTLDYCHLSVDGSVLGVTSFKPVELNVFGLDDEQQSYFMDGKTILVEKDLHENSTQRGRCNFTMAHEASHQIFKMLFPVDYGMKPSRPALHFYRPHSETRKPISDWEEWQANTLAAAILLPVDLVGRALFTFQLPTKIKVLSKRFDEKVFARFEDAANFLGVSKTAFAIRLKQLGILEKDYMDSQYSIIDVFKDEKEKV